MSEDKTPYTTLAETETPKKAAASPTKGQVALGQIVFWWHTTSEGNITCWPALVNLIFEPAEFPKIALAVFPPGSAYLEPVKESKYGPKQPGYYSLLPDGSS